MSFFFQLGVFYYIVVLIIVVIHSPSGSMPAIKLKGTDKPKHAVSSTRYYQIGPDIIIMTIIIMIITTTTTRTKTNKNEYIFHRH